MDETGGAPDAKDCLQVATQVDKVTLSDNNGNSVLDNESLLQRFGVRLAQLVAPGAQTAVVQGAITQAIEEFRETANAGATPLTGFPRAQNISLAGGRNLELVFVHDCRNHGCNQVQCILCKHNPNKRCMGNFAHKYWVGDKLLAKCDGEIQVELIDEHQKRYNGDLSNIRLEVCILDGNKYASRCREAGEQRAEILDECEVLRNQKGEPLLVAGSATNDSANPRVILKFPGNTHAVTLRELKVTESSESVLAGTKRPPFRLVVHAVTASGERMPAIRPAVSEQFVVVTKRTKNLKKQEIPSLDDPISKLNHIGKETVKKLNELKASADEAVLSLKIPRDLYKVMKVRDFQRLAKLSEADGHLQQRLKQLLKLSKEKWDSACEHAKTAVQVDNRMRAWYTKNMASGLLYSCALGDVRPDCPVALINNRQQDGTEIMEVVPMEHQLPAQRQQVQTTCEHAVQCWWDEGHPGWMIFTLGNKHFETLDQIIAYSQGDCREVGEPNTDWANQRTKSDEDGGKGGNVEVVGVGNGGRDNSATSASSGPSDTRYLHDRQMPPPSHAYSMAQNGQAEPGVGVGSRGPNSEPVGTATAGARALGPPEVPQGFPAPPNLLALPPQLLESLGPLVSQFMSAHSMQGLASLQSLWDMQRYQQAGPHQQMAGTPSPMAPQPPEPGSLMQAQYDPLGRGPSGSTPLPTPPPAVAAPLISKSTFNPFESMQRVPFPGGALGGTTGQPTAADPSTPGSQGDGTHSQHQANPPHSLPWGQSDGQSAAAAAATFSGLMPTWGPSGNFMNMNISGIDPGIAQVLSLMGGMDALVSNMSSFNGNSFKGLPSFTNIPGFPGPVAQDHHPDMGGGSHPQSQVPGPGAPPGRGADVSGAVSHSAESEERHDNSNGNKRPRVV